MRATKNPKAAVKVPQGRIVTKTSASFILDGTTHTVTKSHPSFSEISRKLREEDYEGLEELLNVEQQLHDACANAGLQGTIEIRNGAAYYNGTAMDNALGRKLLEEFENGNPLTSFKNFVHKVMKNPSKTAVDELYLFLESGYIALCDDGDILGYKRVREDFTDCHSGTMDNSPGKVVEMPRNQVDDNRHNTCSRGLHFCSYSYLSHFGSGNQDRVVLVKINPADVVSIPSDYSNAKGRCAKYKVVQEVLGWQEADVLRGTHGSAWTDTSDDNWDEDDDEGDDDGWG